MWIARVRVTGGFLADFDVEFRPGLNVVIGPRGAGKTTLLELVRHALGVSHADKRRQGEQIDRIRTMLGAGEVIVDLEGAKESVRVVVDAEGGGRRPEFAAIALMLGQNELETIASDAPSRLNLIDLRAQVEPPRSLPGSVVDLTRALAALRAEAESLSDQLRQRTSLAADLAQLEQQERALLEHATADLTQTRAALAIIEDEVGRLQGALRQVDGAIATVSRFRLENERNLVAVEELSAQPLPSDLAEATAGTLSEIRTSVLDVTERIAELDTAFARHKASTGSHEIELRTQAAPLRASLDEAERGLGEITARSRNLRSQLARLDSLDARLNEVIEQMHSSDVARNDAFEVGEAQQEAAFHARQRVASAVSEQLHNNVVISVEHLADATHYRTVLATLLQGSGLRYQSLVEAIGRTTLPAQLLRLIETSDADGLAELAGVPVERAIRAIAHLHDPDVLSTIAEVVLGDRVDFLLRDGTTTKSVDELSTGQKCAVTLPILLTEHTRALVLDQPEDHLDNAYLVDNIVQALLARQLGGAQTIIATHNANIPVLGSAELVVSMRSDGARGYVKQAGPFDAAPIVEDITSLMEGGRDAFNRRAQFYASHGRPA